MSARAAAFAGLRVVLVAAFNPRYHRSGRALARALTELGCEVRPCEERLRGLNAVLRRPLATRLGALLRRARADLVLVFKGTKLEPADVAELKERFGARWVNWFPDDPHELGVSLALGPAYDYLFTHDSSSLERHRRAGTRAAYLAFGCDPAYHRPLDGGARWRAPLVFVGSRDRARERVVQELAGLGLVAWGPGWPNGPAYGDDFVRVLSGATVGLNIHQHFGEGATQPATVAARTCGSSSSLRSGRPSCRMRGVTSSAISRRIARSCCTGARPSYASGRGGCWRMMQHAARSPPPRGGARCGSTRGDTGWKSC